MADNADGFDRAHGAGWNRGRASGPGQEDKPRAPELTDGEAVFTHCLPLRQPRSHVATTECSDSSSVSSFPSLSSSSSSAVVKARPSHSAVYESTLSAHAPEFIPSTHTPVQDVAYEDYDSYYSGVSLPELVDDILSHLNLFPGSFETDMENITSTLNLCVTTEETLQELVELIFTQSTAIPNFSYTGARFCNYLSHHLTLNPASGNFRQLLLKRCQTEYEKRQQALMGDEESQRRFHNYVLFLGELYLNLEVKSVRGGMCRADVLLNALKDLTLTLFSQPKDRNIICAVKLLKLTGSVLEDAWKQSGMTHMDQLIQKIQGIILDAQCSRDVKQMLFKLVELRSSNWGRVHAAAVCSEATPENDPNYYMNEPTFYTADGTPFTAADPDYSEKYQEIIDREDFFPDLYEENGHDTVYSEEDEMEPEIEEAFEKFCLENERRKP